VVHAWIRQALRASGVAILVPAAVVAAVALSVVGGGGSVGSLGEVLGGPAVPPAEAATQAVQPRRDERRRAGLGGLSPQSGSGLRGPAPQSGRRSPVVPLRPHLPQAPQPAPPAPPAGSAPPAAPAPPSPAPAPAPPHPIHDAGSQVAGTVRPLPVAGPVAADAVQAVADLVDPPA
jgi:hypothetical protein